MKKDVIIIGSGPSGLSLACLLSDLGLKVTIIEKVKLEQLEKPNYDGRETALTHPSKDLLTKIGAWERISKKAISPIKKAQVINFDESQSLDFDNDSDRKAIGYLVSNHEIKKALFAQVKTLDNVEIITQTEVKDIKIDDQIAKVILDNNKVLEASLVAAADSRFSKNRSRMGISYDMHDFAKNMIVCKMEHEKSHENNALECFFDDRVMAVLPLQGNFSSIVITTPKKTAEELVALDEKDFNKDIENYLSHRLGKIKLESKRYSYPLCAVYADKFIADRFVLIGDAAVGMHPVTAHGYNLGLIGQDILCNEIKKALAKGEDIGSKTVLEKYNLNHKKETKIMYHGTNLLVDIFSSNKLPAKILRKLMMSAANSKFLPFKSIISNRLTGKKKFEGVFSIFKNKF